MKNIRVHFLLHSFLILLIIAGVFFRFYSITQDEFFFYDEGLYLNFNRQAVEFIGQHLPLKKGDLPVVLRESMKIALGSGKPLWLFLSDLRVYFLGAHAWFFPRILSAIFGSLTLAAVYCLGWKFYQSINSAGAEKRKAHGVGLLSAAMLAVLPSHVFYSRLALQESLSALLFCIGLLLYLFPRKFSWQTFVSGAVFAGVYFTNYRMIILPILVLTAEGWISLAHQEKFDLRKYLWNALTFFGCVFVIGAIDSGANTKIAFSWMFFQAHLAQGRFHWMDMGTFPYYLFRLESAPFAFMFLGWLYPLAKFILARANMRRQGIELVPFILTASQMLIFSFAQEKAARYMAVMHPLMAVGAALLAAKMWQGAPRPWIRRALVCGMALMFTIHLFKGDKIRRFRSDYKISVMDLAAEKVSIGHEELKIVSSQSFIHKLYTSPHAVISCPYEYAHLCALYQKGFRYLILDPQAYVSNARDKQRFSGRLTGYLDFIVRVIPPVKTYAHFDRDVLERFVFEHTDDLGRAVKFLNSNKDGRLGTLGVYDIGQCIRVVEEIKNKQDGSFFRSDREQKSEDSGLTVHGN